MTICIKPLLRIVSELVVKQVNCTAKLDLKWMLVLFIKKILSVSIKRPACTCTCQKDKFHYHVSCHLLNNSFKQRCPLYFWAHWGVLLGQSAPQPIPHHPLFSPTDSLLQVHMSPFVTHTLCLTAWMETFLESIEELGHVKVWDENTATHSTKE